MTAWRGALLVAATIALAGDAWAVAACPMRASAVHSRDEATARALRAAEVYRLLRIPLACVLPFTETEATAAGATTRWSVTFHENHTDACGGDPATAPRLFTIEVEADGRMRTDAQGDDLANGRFRTLRCPRPAGATGAARPPRS